MADFFDPMDYLAYLRRNARFAVLAIAAAVGLTAAASFVLPKQYTAVATLVIEPPSAMDPRASTTVSAVYLESLKAYEQYAASDSLFEKARQKFHIEDGPGAPASEALRRRVLRVTKLTDTKVLQIRATLQDPKLAQALVQYLAEETVALNRSVANQGERDALIEVRKQVDDAGAKLTQAREQFNAAAAVGSETMLEDEVRSLSDRKARWSEQMAEANTSVAELSARSGSPQEIAGLRARATALDAQIAAANRELATKSAALAAARGRVDRAGDQLRTASADFDAMSRRANELAASGGLRTEQLRIIDPGIVPQQPSFPNTPLLIGSALLISMMLSLAWLSLRYGLDRQRGWQARSEFKVTRGAGR